MLSGIIARIEGDSIFFWNQRIVLLPGAITEPLTIESYVKVTGSMLGGILYASDVLVLGSGPLRTGLVGYIEAVDVAARTLTMFGVEFSVGETLTPGFTVSLGDLAVGDRVHVLSYENRFIRGIERVYGEWFPGMADLSLVEGEFRDLSPPVQFTLHGVADWVVQVTATTFFGYHWLGDPGWPNECGAISVSAERFWQLAAQPKPPGVTSVSAWGRFEGGIFLARSVSICFPAPP